MEPRRTGTTSGERHAERMLRETGIRYEYEKTFDGKNRTVRVDYYLPDTKICLEIDGTVHGSKSQKVRDAEKNSILVDEFGCKVIRIRNSRICNMDANELAAEISDVARYDKPGLYRTAYQPSHRAKGHPITP